MAKFRYTVHDELGVTCYTGFTTFLGCRLPFAMFVIVAQVEDGHELWVVEDEQGFRNLQEYYEIEHRGEDVSFVSLKPFALHKGHLVDPL
jgi:hypothetical protein